MINVNKVKSGKNTAINALVCNILPVIIMNTSLQLQIMNNFNAVLNLIIVSAEDAYKINLSQL